MKILLDHNAPHGLRHALADHDVQTAEHLGWETLRNGDLIRNAVQVSFFGVLIDHCYSRSLTHPGGGC